MNIILTHGILGFDKIGCVAYFNAVEEHIKNKYGSQILITKVSATGSITERGVQLREQILNALSTNVLNPDDETHIIAHSMGGLDSRYILSPTNKDNIAELITSLTTIGTPHRGSPIADWLYPFLDGNAPLAIGAFVEKKVINLLKDLGISTKGLRDLTTDVLTTFNKDYVDSDEVSYFWTAGIGRSGAGFRTSIALLPTYEYINKTGKTNDDKSNDGVVPLSSAVHGEAIGRPWLADHLDEVGHDLDDLPTGIPKHFDYLDRYDEIIDRILLLKKQ